MKPKEKKKIKNVELLESLIVFDRLAFAWVGFRLLAPILLKATQKDEAIEK